MSGIYGNFDVVIAGGGTSGVVAGITAARHGLKTLIIESFGFLGGTQTGALVTPMMELLIDGNPVISSLNEEITKRLEKQGDANGNWFNPEGLKFLLEEMYLEAQGNILYFTHIIEVLKEGNSVIGAKIYNKSGIQKVFFKILIDCTGDADVAFLAGVPTEKGKKSTGINQPMSLRFEVGNIDLLKFGSYLKNLGQISGTEPETFYGAHTSDNNWPLTPVFNKALEEATITKEDAKYFQFFAIPGKPNALAFNCPEIFYDTDGTNGDHLTKAAIMGRQAVKRLMTFMKNYFPGFEESYVLLTAPMVGVRESRRIIGEYMLTSEDVSLYKKFDDGIAKCNYYMDIHDMSQEDKDKISSFKEIEIDPEEKYFEIPYRCCIPLQVENILVAGRCISADFEAQSAMRIQQVCRAIGEGCGHAAYISITKHQSLINVNGKEIRSLMRKLGAQM